MEESCPDFLITWLTDWLTEYRETGLTFTDGQILPYGWSVLKCLVEDHCLRLFAPDFQSMPMNGHQILQMLSIR